MDAVADHDGDVTHAHEVLERKLVVRPRRVPRGQDGALDDVHIGAGLLHDVGALLGPCRDRRDRAGNAGVLDCLDPFADQLRLDRLAVRLPQHCVQAGPVGLGDLPDDGSGVLVARVDSIEVQDRDAAELAHRDGEFDVDDAVHRRTPERKRQ